MGLCTQRACGCAVQSSTLAITGSGSSGDPWIVDIPLSSSQLPYYTFASTAARDLALPAPAEGQLCWIQNLDEEHHYTGAAWRVWYKGPTAFTYVMVPTPVPAGFANGNATQIGRYSIADGILHVAYQYMVGSSSNFGTATSFTPQFPLPAGLTASAVGSLGRGDSLAGWVYDNSTARAYPIVGVLNASLNTQIDVFNVGGQGGQNFTFIGNSQPMSGGWASGDEINFSGSLPLAA